MSGRFVFHGTPLSGVTLLERKPISDRRGFLERLFCADDLHEIGFSKPVAQSNRSFTRLRGTVRGLHFQHPPYAETKLVCCLRGELFDVAVDLRPESPSFLRWHGEILSGENCRSLLVPEGFAHGFQTLTDDCELLYFCSAPYAPQYEDGVHAQDETLSIAWPIAITDLSDRDASLRRITPGYAGIRL